MGLLERLFPPPDIKKLVQRGDLNGLLKALNYTRGKPEDARRVRRQAREAVIIFGDEAIEPVSKAYLYNAQAADPKDVMIILREIGRRTIDPLVRVQVAEKLADLLDLRKEHRAGFLRALFTLACQPNAPAFYAVVPKILTTWLQDPAPLIRLEAALGLLVIAVQTRDYPGMERWFGQVASSAYQTPQISRRVASALGEAGPVFTDTYLQEKTVALLTGIATRPPAAVFQTPETATAAHERAVAAALDALKMYPVNAVPLLLARLKAQPDDRLAREGLEIIARHVHNGPHEEFFIQTLQPCITQQSSGDRQSTGARQSAGDRQSAGARQSAGDRLNWDFRKTTAEILHSMPWTPKDMQARVEMLVALRDFSPASWSGVQPDRHIIEWLASVADDPQYPASEEVIRQLGTLPEQLIDREARLVLRGMLVEFLRCKSPQVHPYLIRGLSILQWIPGNDAAGAIYWLFKNDPVKAAAVGKPAIDTLLASLSAPEPPVRQAAARALIAMYQSATTDSDSRARILTARERIDNLTGIALRDMFVG